METSGDINTGDNSDDIPTEVVNNEEGPDDEKREAIRELDTDSNSHNIHPRLSRPQIHPDQGENVRRNLSMPTRGLS